MNELTDRIISALQYNYPQFIFTEQKDIDTTGEEKNENNFRPQYT